MAGIAGGQESVGGGDFKNTLSNFLPVLAG